MERNILQYAPFSSFVDPGFWHKFTQIKLDIDKLNDKRKNIWGCYSYQNEVGNIFEVDSTSFNSVPDVQKFHCFSHGMLLNKNTIEEFKTCDKTELLKEEGTLLWKDIQNGKCFQDPSLLSRFLVLSFADLKKYQYYYWFAFPAPSHPFVYLAEEPTPLNKMYDEQKIKFLADSHDGLDANQKPFFVVAINEDTLNAVPLSNLVLEEFQNRLISENHKYCFGFLDPSDDEHPGWILRNFITFLLYHFKWLHGTVITVISLRFKRSNDLSKSLIYKIDVPKDLTGDWATNWVGWERNDKNHFGPRFTNMASSMDPKLLAESSVDLNLKLMKWRLLPNIDLDIIKNIKCLLLGAGTLGCSVARNLMAWGVRNITFVDNGKVSFSNPVRQSLYTHEDCINGGKLKAIAAAENLKKIFPGMDSKGVNLHIPMPGHPVGEALKERTEKNLEILTNLVSEHDIIFLLLDSREARWLPTMLAAHFKKLAINAALGFDSYLVMRHGIHDEDSTTGKSDDRIKEKLIRGNKLGCYFCNDVTAPGNSQRDRTLDQQCTVTRPGVSHIAASLAVEMAISIIQHDKKIDASAPYNFTGEFHDSEGVLGGVPHSIRGFLSSHQQVLPSTRKFEQCIACSSTVIDAYRSERTEFLFNVFESAKYLEDLTGLTGLHAETNDNQMWELTESSADEEEEIF